MSTEEEPGSEVPEESEAPEAAPDEEPTDQEWQGGFSAEPIYEPPKHFGSEPTITGWFGQPGVLPAQPVEEPDAEPEWSPSGGLGEETDHGVAEEPGDGSEWPSPGGPRDEPVYGGSADPAAEPDWSAGSGGWREEPETAPVEKLPEWASDGWAGAGGWREEPETAPVEKSPESEWPPSGGVGEQPDGEPSDEPAVGSDWPLRPSARLRDGWQEEPWTGPSDDVPEEFGAAAYAPPQEPSAEPAWRGYGQPEESGFGRPEEPRSEENTAGEVRSGPRHGRRAGHVRDEPEQDATRVMPAPARPSRSRRAKKRSGSATVFSVLVAVLGTAWVVFAFVGRPALRLLRRLSSHETRPRWMTRLPGNRFALATLIALAVAALYGVASFARPAASEPAGPTRVPPPSAAAVCPDPSEARVSAVTSPGSRGAGRVEVAGGPRATLTSPGTAWSATAKKGSGAWTFGAAGSLASGLTVEQTSGHGDLAGVRCDEPAADQWFMGPGPLQAKDVALTLTNADDRPVTVGIESLSDDGSIETVDGHNISIGGHTTRLIHVGKEPDGLGNVAAGVKLIALRVRAANGRIAAAVRVQRAKGADWLPATRPGTSLVVPGVASGTGARRLLVAVPGRDEAAVEVQIMSPDGTFAPAGQRVLQAAALAVTPLDLGLGGKPAGIRLVSDHPIVASLVAEQGNDFAVSAAVPPLGAGGLVAEDKDRSTLLLTAPGAAAVVRVTQITEHGPASTGQDVRVPAGRTIEVSMPPPAGAAGSALSVVPRPGSGSVYAARSLKVKGQGITILPIAPARTSVLLPPVADVPLP